MKQTALLDYEYTHLEKIPMFLNSKMCSCYTPSVLYWILLSKFPSAILIKNNNTLVGSESNDKVRVTTETTPVEGDDDGLSSTL